MQTKLEKYEARQFAANPMPFSVGYFHERERQIEVAIRERERERERETIGVGIDERIIELPWIFHSLSRLASGGKIRLLDAGSALNHHFFLEHLAPMVEMDIITLAPESVCENQRGISYHYGDLRDLPYKEALFDAVACISTLEHVGMDNTRFKPDTTAQHATKDAFKALRELHRVLKPGGTLFLTVPFGRYEDHGWFQQFDASLLNECRTIFAPTRSEETFWRYTADGWRLSDASGCADARYATTPGGEDNAAAARAVACCAWWK